MVIHHNKWKWGDSYTIISDNGNAVIEFTVSNDEPEVAYLKGLSVYEAYRKKGLGNLMMIRALERAKSVGCKYAYLHADNSSFVFEWYKRLGFKYYGDAPNENGFVPMYIEL